MLERCAAQLDVATLAARVPDLGLVRATSRLRQIVAFRECPLSEHGHGRIEIEDMPTLTETVASHHRRVPKAVHRIGALQQQPRDELAESVVFD